MLTAILGTKIQLKQTFLKDGTRVPVTKIQAGPCIITQIKDGTKDGYDAVQLGLGQIPIKRIAKPQRGHLSKAGLPHEREIVPRLLREVRVDAETAGTLKVGEAVTADQVLAEGDLVHVTGTSRGKGFTGVMKRWGFKGGPRTHGQSDRPRAPGSIGQTTTPGRVYKGKRMAGRSGNQRVTLKNLLILKVQPDGEVWIKGQVPGMRRGPLTITKIGRSTFIGLHEETTGQRAPSSKDSTASKVNAAESADGRSTG